MSTFSGALQLTDLNDYIAPSQACIKPVQIPKGGPGKDGAVLTLDDTSGTYYEVSKDGEATALSEKATITLNDCLACSGCVTSAESVLVAEQSLNQVLEFVQSQKQPKQLQQQPQPQQQGANGDSPPLVARELVITIAPQCIASLAAKYGLHGVAVAKRVTWLCKTVLGATRVVDAAFFRTLALREAAEEFVWRYKAHAEKYPTSPFFASQSGQNVVDVESPAATAPEDDSAPSAGGARPRARRRRILGSKAGASEASPDLSSHSLPMLASACPGWICYAEKTQQFVLPLVSSTKSPQQISGSLVRKLLGPVYHVSVMPCYDKKLEASRVDFYNEATRTRDVDCVITTTELDQLCAHAPVEYEYAAKGLAAFPEAPLDPWFQYDAAADALVATPGSSSGAYLEHVLAYAAHSLHGLMLDPTVPGPSVEIAAGRTADLVEWTLRHPGTGAPILRAARVYGFRNIQNLLRKIKQGAAPWHYVEVMACPAGCVNGGGQLPAPSADVLPRDWIATVDAAYAPAAAPARTAFDDPALEALYAEVVGGTPGSVRARELLHTQYHAVMATVGLSTKW